MKVAALPSRSPQDPGHRGRCVGSKHARVRTRGTVAAASRPPPHLVQQVVQRDHHELLHGPAAEVVEAFCVRSAGTPGRPGSCAQSPNDPKRMTPASRTHASLCSHMQTLMLAGGEGGVRAARGAAVEATPPFGRRLASTKKTYGACEQAVHVGGPHVYVGRFRALGRTTPKQSPRQCRQSPQLSARVHELLP